MILTPETLLLIEFTVDGRGYPKGLVLGNLLCWYGLFEWIAKHVKKPDAKLLKKWNYRKKQFGNVNTGRDCAVKSLFTAVLQVRDSGTLNTRNFHGVA